MYQPYPAGAQLPATQRPPVPPSVAPIAGAIRAWALVVWLVALVVVILLWRPGSNAFFTPAPPR